MTEIYDYLRLLFARVGMPYSPATGLPIESQTVSQMVDRIMAMPEGTRLYLLAPIVRGRKGEYRKELPDLQKRGFQRVQVDGKLYEIDEVPALNKKLKHDIEVVVDRIVVRDGIRDAASPTASRPRSAWPTAWSSPTMPTPRRARRRAAGRIIFSVALRLPGLRLHHRRDRAAAVLLQQPVRRLPGLRRPRQQALFRSRARRAGRARRLCAKGAIAPWANSTSPYYMQTLDSLARHYKFSTEHRLQASCRRRSATSILYGTGERAGDHDASTTGCAATRPRKPFEGVIPNMERRCRETDSAWVREELARYPVHQPLRGLQRRRA